MALTIRLADLVADRTLMIETLRRFLTPLSDEARFQWLYIANPAGPAAAWIASDPERGETVGMSSAFPRRAAMEGREASCWVLGDFCIHESYRTLGPALQLNRACLSRVDQGAVPFCYDFPSHRMMAIYRRLNLTPFGELTRYARVLRWSGKLRAAYPGAAAVVGPIGALADFWPARRSARIAGVSIDPDDRPCGAEYDDLDRALETSARVHMSRSAAFLNWRFRACPLAQYEFLAARRGAELLGYAVFSQTGSDGLIADLAARSTDVAAVLLDATAAALRGRGAATVSTPVMSSHPLASVLERSGFRPREAAPVVIYRPKDGAAAAPDTAADLPLLYADRDSG